MESDTREAGRSQTEHSLTAVQPVEVRLVKSDAEHEVWRGMIARHHYLGCPRDIGRRVGYLVISHDRLIGAIGWKSAALKLEARDSFIGWTAAQRGHYLAHVINNDRFVIAEEVRVKNLASHVLARSMRMVSGDWLSRYGVEPYVLESFVDPALFSGSCYRAAGWQRVGRTKGYEKLRHGYRYHGQRKEVYLYVVEKEFRRIIGCQSRSYPQRGSRITQREGVLRMMMQQVGFDPKLIEWAQVQSERKVISKELVAFHNLFEDCFRRVEQRVLGESYLCGLLSDIPRKNVEAIALTFQGSQAVRCLQNFLSRYPWDEESMLDRYQHLLATAIGQEDGMLSVDSTEMAKKGKESVGVARQYCGNKGKKENCQSGVFIGYTSRIGYGLVDRQLYLPQSWFTEEYAERRKKCGIPSEVEFRTKHEIALLLLGKQREREVLRARWIGCDASFGSDQKIRDTVAGWGKYYLAGMRSDQKAWRPLRKAGTEVWEDICLYDVAMGKTTVWQQVVLGEGAKGPVTAQLSIHRVRENRDGKPGHEVWLIIRRKEDGALQYYFSNAPGDIDPEELTRAMMMRWPIEQCFEDGKKYLGMDHYENRSWNGWHRHMLYVFLALLFLLRLRLKLKKNSHPHIASSPATPDRGLRAAAAGSPLRA
jgi:SRSO17 transposase